MQLDPSQEIAVRLMCEEPISVVTGVPGCHAAGQLVLRADGTSVRVEDVRPGDRLLGDTGYRTVLNLCRGNGEMVRIVPVKGTPFVVNLDHILTLVHSTTNQLHDVAVREWLSASKDFKHHAKLVRVAVDDFDRADEDLPLDPYFLGVLLGDGMLGPTINITKNDPEIAELCATQAAAFGLRLRVHKKTTTHCASYFFSRTLGTAKINPLSILLRSLGLWLTRSDTKFIPAAYKFGSRPVRLAMLAGLIDTDGYVHSGCVDYVSASEALATDVAFVARSLGFAAYVVQKRAGCQTGVVGTYWRVSISGSGMELIPTRISRKRLPVRQQKKNPLRTGFKVEALPDANFYGFTLDGNGRYLLGDFTVTHNSGKSTITREALEEFHKAGLSYALCAPTGKAARRLSEVTQQPAQTIHRLLEFSYQFGGFQRNRSNPLDVDMVLTDESSMIDLRLAASLLQAVDASRTRICFVGDANQLPPVGPGAFFRDMIDSKVVPTQWLTKVHRAAEKSWVYRNAPKILAGTSPELDDCEDFEWHQFGHDQGAFIGQAILDLIKGHKLENTDTQVLAPMNKRVGGVTELNGTLQSHLNPGGGYGWEVNGYTLRAGDRIIQKKNNYKLGVFNGEIGVVQSMNKHEMLVNFEGNLVVYDHASAYDVQLAYAITIHSGQGSQYQNVVVVCHSDHSIMLTRQLLYTAITRAKERVFLVGDEGGLQLALRTTKDITRKTLLKQRILGVEARG